jgi:3-hydroxyisobutyrate dehydrogenase-like beta-hydroxyacid dehydrogenase
VIVRVGFIGLGSQGAPMARRIAEAGHPLTIWGRRAASVEPFADTGATVATTPAALGAESDVVGICVVGDADVEEVLLGPDGVLAGMAPGGVVAIHATVHPDTCRRLAEEAAHHDVAVIDAPVSGGAPAAEQGRLLVMAGGDEAALDRCRPVFAAFADPVIHLGPVGSGQVAKLVNNLALTVHMGVALSTFSLADGLGVDRSALAEVLAHGSGGSRAAAILAASGFDLAGLRQAVPLLRKDVDIVTAVATASEAGGLPDLLAEVAERALAMLAEEQ